MDEGHRTAWRTYIREGRLAELRDMVSQPGFDFKETVTLNFWGTDNIIKPTRAMTSLGYAFHMRLFGAFQILLSLGADPNATHLFYNDDALFGNCTFRLVERCLRDAPPIKYLYALIDHGATLSFERDFDGCSFIEHVKNTYDHTNERPFIILAAHDRELRAYTVVWCALNAGGSWPDMAMLLQAMVMRDELICEVSTPLSKRREK